MPPKLKWSHNDDNTSHELSERKNASKTVSLLFLKAVSHFKKNITEKKIYDYFESKNIHLKDCLEHLGVMTRSGGVYQSQRHTARKKNQDPASNVKTEKTTNLSIPKTSNRKNTDNPEERENKRKQLAHPNVKKDITEPSSIKPKSIIQTSSDSCVSKSNQNIINLNIKSKKTDNRKAKEEKHIGKFEELKEKAIILTTQQIEDAEVKTSKNMDRRHNNLEVTVSDFQDGLNKRKLGVENDGSMFSRGNFSGENNSLAENGKIMKSALEQKDIIQLGSSKGVGGSCDTTEKTSFDEQVKFKKSAEKKNIDAPMCDEKPATKSGKQPQSQKCVKKRKLYS